MKNEYLEDLRKAQGCLTDKVILYCDKNCNRRQDIEKYYFVEFIKSLFNYAEFNIEPAFVEEKITETFFSSEPKTINFYSIKELVLSIYDESITNG